MELVIYSIYGFMNKLLVFIKLSEVTAQKILPDLRACSGLIARQCGKDTKHFLEYSEQMNLVDIKSL